MKKHRSQVAGVFSSGNPLLFLRLEGDGTDVDCAPAADREGRRKRLTSAECDDLPSIAAQAVLDTAHRNDTGIPGTVVEHDGGAALECC